MSVEAPLAPPLNPAEQVIPPAVPEARADFMEDLHRDSFAIDDEASIYPVSHIGVSEGNDSMKLSVIGEIGIPDGGEGYNHAAILKVAYGDGRKYFMLQGLTTQEDGTAYRSPDTKPVLIGRTGGETIVGRLGDGAADRRNDPRLVAADELWPGQRYTEQVSRQQLSLKIEDGNLVLTDRSVNGTKLQAFKKSEKSAPEEYPTDVIDENVAHHTIASLELAEQLGQMKEGLYAGRPVINRDTSQFEGAVDIRSTAGKAEAIVVDSEKYPEPYNFLRARFDVFVRRQELSTGKTATEKELLDAVQKAVTEAMDYDLEYTNQVSDELLKSGPSHRKINLASYLQDGKGVCRHMALAAGWLTEKLQNEGRLTGRPTVEVNQNADNSAHEYMRYQTEEGEIYVVDPTRPNQGVLTLAETIDKSDWNYFRPGEKRAYMQQHLARKLSRSTRQVKEPELIDRIPDWVNKRI